MLRSLFKSLALSLIALPIAAEEITVAVASNFLVPMQEIVAAFEAETGNTVNIASGSSGRLYAQIRNGAPYHAFFSADQDKPALLIEEGLADSESHFTYATGTLVLWTRQENADPFEQLTGNSSERLAMANPRLAPYGEAAMQVLESLGLLETYENKIVLGENINQAYQFVMTGNAQAGFISLSQLSIGDELHSGRVWIVPGNLHESIRQDAVLLNEGKKSDLAKKFLSFVDDELARKIIRKFSYLAD